MTLSEGGRRAWLRMKKLKLEFDWLLQHMMSRTDSYQKNERTKTLFIIKIHMKAYFFYDA